MNGLDLLNELNNVMFGGSCQPEKNLKLDIKENEGFYEILVDVPGVKKEDIEIELLDNVLTIKAKAKNIEEKKYVLREREVTDKTRSIEFSDVSGEVSAKLDNGLLNIKVFKVKKEKKYISVE